jgi:hypothetical protein
MVMVIRPPAIGAFVMCRSPNDSGSAGSIHTPPRETCSGTHQARHQSDGAGPVNTKPGPLLIAVEVLVKLQGIPTPS